jgi:hypothetical protein
MPSPFPGMNPYLEQNTVWNNFQQQFCPLCVEMLVPQVRPHFIVMMDEHVYIHELSAEERIPPAVDVLHEGYVKILDRNSRRVVTVIELLSPTNKRTGPDREQFLAKRRQVLASETHYVEIDLLRGGPKMPIEGMVDCDYYALVSRYPLRPYMDFWPLRLRESLPTIPIPLTENLEAHLDLQAMLHRMYDAVGYEDYIYDGEPQPRLHPDDAQWASQFVKRTNN